MTPPKSITARLKQFLRARGITHNAVLGSGKDGHVWKTNRSTAIKIHEVSSSYYPERDAYIRLSDLNIDQVAGFSLPSLIEFDDELLAIEMTVVSPPYVLDFASAILDDPPDLIEDEGHTLYDLIQDRFGEQAEQIIDLYHELSARAGIYILDFHKHNIKF